jgi:hypothetical protein
VNGITEDREGSGADTHDQFYEHDNDVGDKEALQDAPDGVSAIGPDR